MNEAFDNVYTAPEVAKLMKLAISSTYAAMAKGEIPTIHISGARRVPGWWIRQQLEEPATVAEPAPVAA